MPLDSSPVLPLASLWVVSMLDGYGWATNTSDAASFHGLNLNKIIVLICCSVVIYYLLAFDLIIYVDKKE